VRRDEDARPDEAKAANAPQEVRPHEPTVGNARGIAATLVVLSTLALVAFLVMVLRSAAPVGIAEVLAAASGLLAAASAAIRGR
jgi:hypothetical protein